MQQKSDLSIGKQTPSFELKNLAGKMVRPFNDNNAFLLSSGPPCALPAFGKCLRSTGCTRPSAMRLRRYCRRQSILLISRSESTQNLEFTILLDREREGFSTCMPDQGFLWAASSTAKVLSGNRYNRGTERSNDRIKQIYASMTPDQRKDLRQAFKNNGYDINAIRC